MNSNADRIKRMQKIVDLLVMEYPDSKCSLKFNNSFQLLVATILSAQCTDIRVNKVTSLLFKHYKTAKDFNNMPLSELKKFIFSTGFYNNKAISIKKLSKIICEKYSGKIPNNLKMLVELGGK